MVEKAIRFEDYAWHWMKTHVKIFLKYSTSISYEICLKNHILPAFGTKPIDTIRRRDIKEFMLAKLSEGLSLGTVKNIKTCLSCIFTCGIEDEIVTSNPTAQLGKQINKIERKRGDKHEIKPFNRDEVKLLLATARIHYPRYYPLFMCALRTGMRAGELIGLQPKDLDFTERLIHVRRAIVKKKVTTPKNGKSRKVDMSKQLTEVLQEHLLEREREASRKGWSEPPEWLFYNRHGNPVDPDNLRKRQFYKCLEKAGLRRIRFHDCRHGFASLLIAQSESLVYVKDQLGHSNISIMVDTYGHMVPGENRDAVDKLDDR